MSISQLDDPSMREALGIETDNPSQLTSPVAIGSVTLTDDGGGQLGVGSLETGSIQLGSVQLNDNGNGQLGLGQLGSIQMGFSAVTGLSTITTGGISYTQESTGTTSAVVAWDKITGTADLNDIAKINGAAYPPPTPSVTPNNTAQTGNYAFANIPSYPSSIWYDTISNRIANGKKFLLTMCLNFTLTPPAPFVGPDVIVVRCGQQTGSPSNPVNDFAQPQISLIYPDGTAHPFYSFTVVNQVELTGDGNSQWSVILEALSGGHNYTIGGTAGVLSIVELFT